ncbi:hypothetical protein FOPG_19648 [Fusarium oxysporum f. sp. conglutinans race 2 54008]|uniref:Uncharacterized protein n=1 Tax=Fusarium oxysporum f. sp. conglutinans race 2 54008 TaxID=1089457 RepID=X0GKA9_FUSOX|nr:hypothetical protein FOPG_19648 [Fusarium oxysporum f. sp. conglutinans race 2 54008]
MSAAFELGYVTQDFPITLSNGEDLPTFKEVYENKQKSGAYSPIHRTESLNYGIVIVGELECVLDLA